MNPVPQQDLWSAVDRALEAWLAPPDQSLSQTAASSTRAGLPEIAVAPTQGRLLEVLARTIGARRILEIGTLAGYSAIWLARALPSDGELITLELEPDRARLARENIARANLPARVEVMVGPAVASLDALRKLGTTPFDLIFIDADKEQCPAYLEHAVALSREGTLIVVDNVIRRGRLIEEHSGDASVEGVRAMMDRIAQEPRFAAAGIQTVGAKGYDGLLIMLVGKPPAREASSADTLELMLAHNTWSTRELLRLCQRIDEGSWHRRFEIGPGSLHDALTHVVGAMFRWADRLDAPPQTIRPSIEETHRRSPTELLALLEQASTDLEASITRARARGLGTMQDVVLGGTPYRFSLGAMIVHVATHGMHHRAQCLNMLRHLKVPGVSDELPDLDVLAWSMLASTGGQSR